MCRIMIRDRGLWSPRDGGSSKSQCQADFYFCVWMSGGEQGQQRSHQSLRTAEQRGKGQAEVCWGQPKDAQISSGEKNGAWKDFDKACERSGDEPKAVKTHLMGVNIWRSTWCQCCIKSGIIAREERFFFFNMGSIILGKYNFLKTSWTRDLF